MSSIALTTLEGEVLLYMAAVKTCRDPESVSTKNPISVRLDHTPRPVVCHKKRCCRYMRPDQTRQTKPDQG